MSIHLSAVCPVPDPKYPKSRTEGHRKLKIGRNETHDAGDPGPYLEMERSKVKVTRPINAKMENALYLPNGETVECQTWYRDEVQ